MRYDIIEIVVPIRMYLIEGCRQLGSFWTKGLDYVCEIEVITWYFVRFPP
jgi:hypothetical protein